MNTQKREARATQTGLFVLLFRSHEKGEGVLTVALKTLFVGQYIELEDSECNMLVAQIQELDTYTFKIGSIITMHKVSIPGLLTQEVYIYFKGGAGEKYQFKTKVIGQSRVLPPNLQLAMPKDRDILKVNKREYFRVPAEVDFELENWYGDLPESLYKTIDISGGGLSFFSKETSFTGSETDIKGKMYLENGTGDSKVKVMIPFEARIVYQSQVERGYRIAIEFTSIRESHRDLIIKFCMKEQLNRRK